jgi:hypothetical protein
MRQENASDDKQQQKQTKTAYSELVNDTMDLLVNQPMEAMKKFVQATIDTQSEVLTTLASAGKYVPIVDHISQDSSKLLQFYLNQVQQSKEASGKALNVFTEATIAWQKVAADAGKSAIDANAAWFAKSTQASG